MVKLILALVLVLNSFLFGWRDVFLGLIWMRLYMCGSRWGFLGEEGHFAIQGSFLGPRAHPVYSVALIMLPLINKSHLFSGIKSLIKLK